MTPPPLNTTAEQTGRGITLTEFHLFPELPIELRLQVWAMSIQPRIIKPRFSEDRKCRLHKFNSPIPTLLHINSESRKEGLRHYILSLQRRNAMNQFYFNPKIDVIYVPKKPYIEQCSNFLEGNDCGLWAQVQSLAIEDMLARRDELLEFPALRLFTYVHSNLPHAVYQDCDLHGTECAQVAIGETLKKEVKDYMLGSWKNRNVIADRKGLEVGAEDLVVESTGLCNRRWGGYTALSLAEIQRFCALNPSPTGCGGVDQTSPCTCASPAL